MEKNNMGFSKTEAFSKLKEHHLEIKEKHLRQMFADHPEERKGMVIKTEHVYYDYARPKSQSEND